jgi:GWxTD domain-containing protein
VSPRSRSLPRGAAVVLGAALVVFAGPVRRAEAAKLDKAAETWLKQVRLFILPEEQSLFRELPDAADRKEFERIFWARRDPDPRTPVNELEEAVQKARRRADDLFTIPGGGKGSNTGCGQVLALLGEPLERTGREVSATFNAAPYMQEGALQPETWTYRSRPGDAVTFTGGELRINFDSACRFAEGGRVLEDLQRVAASLVVRPELGYERKADGHLVPLESLHPAAGADARALLASARADFPVAAEPRLLIRTQTGEAYAAGLLRADLGGAASDASPGTPPAPARIAAAVVDESGGVGAVAERAVRPAKGPDGSEVVSWGLTVKPGEQTLHVALKAGDRAAVAPVTIDVPDFNAPGLKTSTLLVYPETAPASPAASGAAAAPADPEDAYAALTLGSLRLQPRFDNAFTGADQLAAVCVLYGGATDPATGKASLKARYSFVKDGRAVARGEEESFATPMAVASVGPVPLSSFAKGRYTVRLEIHDEVAGKTETREAPFEIRE